MALERDRQISEAQLQEETLYRVGIEVGILSRLQKPFGFKDTFDGKMNEEGLYGDSRPLSSVLDPEMMEEVDALAWLSWLDPESMGNAMPFNYGYDLVSFNEDHLRPSWAEARARNLQDAQRSVRRVSSIVSTAHQRVTEILNRKQVRIISEFDEKVLTTYLETVQENEEKISQTNKEGQLLQNIQNKKQVLEEQIGTRINRAKTRIEDIANKLSIYVNIPHDLAVLIVLQLHKISGPHIAQTIEEAGAEDHIERCDNPLCSMFRPLYGCLADTLNPEQKAVILAEIDQRIEQLREEQEPMRGFFIDPEGNVRRGAPTWVTDKDGNTEPVYREFNTHNVYPREK